MEDILKTVPVTMVKHFQSLGLTIERNEGNEFTKHDWVVKFGFNEVYLKKGNYIFRASDNTYYDWCENISDGKRVLAKIGAEQLQRMDAFRNWAKSFGFTIDLVLEPNNFSTRDLYVAVVNGNIINLHFDGTPEGFLKRLHAARMPDRFQSMFTDKLTPIRVAASNLKIGEIVIDAQTRDPQDAYRLPEAFLKSRTIFEVLPGKWADAFTLDGVKLVD